MCAFSPDQWRVLSPYLDQAFDVSPEERPAWLESLRQENPALATDLEGLLREHDSLGDEGFLQTVVVKLPSTAPLTGQPIGAYTLEAPIGQGGMGTVWVARRSDGRFEGRAAVKFLNIALLGGASEVRFKREGSILARLAHPNIAHLIDAGVSATGQPYLILEYVEGSQIDKYCSEHARELPERIQLFLDVLAAVAHAHANLIIHRDIKPSNVLVTRDGRVKLLDFGIAKLLENDASSGAATVLTHEGGRALTFAYAAPEQVTGNDVTTGTDVYALGILLYQLLSGKHPAESALHSPADLMKAIVETPPLPPSEAVARTTKLGRALQGDLDTIAAKALKKKPAERYASVTALADDLRRYLKNEPISARPDSLAYRATKFVKRNKIAVSLAGAALVATVAGLIGTMIEAHRAALERDMALLEYSRAAAINELNLFVLSDAAPSGKPFTANDLLTRAEKLVEGRRGGSEINRIELLLSLGRQYAYQGQTAKGRRLLDQAYALARAVPERTTRARTSCVLIRAVLSEGDLSRAEKLFQEGLSELGDERRYAIERATCLAFGSEVANARGQPREAIVRAKAAQRALSQSPIKTEQTELTYLLPLASAYRGAGQLDDASATFEQASARLAAVGDENSRLAAIIFNNWGMTLTIAGRPLEAEQILRRAIVLTQDDQSEASVPSFHLINYARSLNELGRLNEAADYAERGCAKTKAAGDTSGVMSCLLLKTSIYRRQGDIERAAQGLLELEPMLRRRHPDGHIAFSSLAWQQALNAQARDEFQTALDLANRAVAIAEASMKGGGEGAVQLPVYLAGRSEIHLHLGQKDEATGDAERALKMSLEAIQRETLTTTVGRASVALGRALQAQGKRQEAGVAFRTAVEHLQGALGPEHEETRAARGLVESS